MFIYKDVLFYKQANASIIKEIKSGPFICEDFDEIVKIGKCDRNFVCIVHLKSGKTTKHSAPIERELIPCLK